MEDFCCSQGEAGFARFSGFAGLRRGRMDRICPTVGCRATPISGYAERVCRLQTPYPNALRQDKKSFSWFLIFLSWRKAVHARMKIAQRQLSVVHKAKQDLQEKTRFSGLRKNLMRLFLNLANLANRDNPAWICKICKMNRMKSQK